MLFRSGRFVTGWYARVRLNDGAVECIAAGQGPILHYVRASDSFVTLPTDLPPMGVLPDDAPDERTVVRMAPGDMLLALTDGYFESEAPAGEQWQQERAEALVRSMRDASPRELLDACNEAMRTWCAGRPAADDRTAIVLKRLG